MGKRLATAFLPLDQGVILGVWSGHEKVWGWSRGRNFMRLVLGVIRGSPKALAESGTNWQNG